MSSPPIRLAMIDDSKVDRKAFEAKLLAAGKPFMRNVEVDFREHPFETLEEYRAYDGIVLDNRLVGAMGTEIALKLNLFDWRIPVVLITGDTPDALPPDVRDYVWGVGFKHGASKHKIDGEFGVMRQFLRTIGLIKEKEAEIERLRAEVEALRTQQPGIAGRP